MSLSPKAPTVGEHAFEALCPGHRADTYKSETSTSRKANINLIISMVFAIR